MPEITELLERTTPRTPPAFDVADLARRGRRRRLRTQVGTGMGAVAVIAAAVAGLGLVAPGDQGQVVASRPPTGELAEAFAAAGEPIGTWEQVADPPFSPRVGAFTGTASDGRVVVWGGAPSADGGGTEGGGALTDGGVYNPEDGTWDAIPPAPVPSGVSFHWSQVASDRLMVLGSPNGWGLVGAVYDVDSGEWTQIDPPPPSTIGLPVEGIAWTGDTLVLARFSSGPEYGGEAVFPTPVAERWSLESGDWESGATPPLTVRTGPAVAFDGDRLGVWGGSRGRGLLGDGAVYDIAADRWDPMMPGPLPPTAAASAVWLDGGLAVAGGQVASNPNGDDVPGVDLYESDAGAVYDPATSTWTSLAEAPTGKPGTQPAVPFAFTDYAEPILVVDQLYGQIGSVQPVSFYDEITRTWLDAPLPDLHTSAGTLVATSRTRSGPGGDPFEVQVLAGSVWEPATEAPFVNRMDAGVAVTGQSVLVVGGAVGPDLAVTGDAWLLRFDVDAGD